MVTNERRFKSCLTSTRYTLVVIVVVCGVLCCCDSDGTDCVVFLSLHGCCCHCCCRCFVIAALSLLLSLPFLLLLLLSLLSLPLLSLPLLPLSLLFAIAVTCCCCCCCCQVHRSMRTYEGGLAVLEHYMRRVDEDENDGRESTKILGVLRAAALQKLE